MRARIFSSVLLIGVVCSCSRSPSEFTVDYYRAHPDERREKVSACANDPGALRDDPLCVNAREAEALESVGSLRSLPPMGLVEAEREAKRKKEVAGGRERAQEE